MDGDPSERFLRMSSFQYAFMVGPGRGNLWVSTLTLRLGCFDSWRCPPFLGATGTRWVRRPHVWTCGKRTTRRAIIQHAQATLRWRYVLRSVWATCAACRRGWSGVQLTTRLEKQSIDRNISRVAGARLVRWFLDGGAGVSGKHWTATSRGRERSRRGRLSRKDGVRIGGRHRCRCRADRCAAHDEDIAAEVHANKSTPSRSNIRGTITKHRATSGRSSGRSRFGFRMTRSRYTFPPRGRFA